MWLVLAILVATHLLLVNVASGAPIVCMWLDWRAAKGCQAAEAARVFLAKSSLYALLLGGVLGLLAFVLIWTPEMSQAFEALASKIKYGALEYLFSLVLLGIYVYCWPTPANSSGGAVFRAFIMLLAGSNLLYHFPFLFLILSNVANGVTPSAEPITSADFRSLMVAGDVLPRALHFIVACFAVTGVWLFWSADRKVDEKYREQWVRWGGNLALGPTMLQILIGFWIITALPRAGMRSLMGQDLIATSLFLVSVLLAFWLMHLFSMVALGKSDQRGRSKAAIVLVAVVLLMSGVVQRIQVAVKPAAQQSAPTDEETA